MGQEKYVRLNYCNDYMYLITILSCLQRSRGCELDPIRYSELMTNAYIMLADCVVSHCLGYGLWHVTVSVLCCVAVVLYCIICVMLGHSACGLLQWCCVVVFVSCCITVFMFIFVLCCVTVFVLCIVVVSVSVLCCVAVVLYYL